MFFFLYCQEIDKSCKHSRTHYSYEFNKKSKCTTTNEYSVYSPFVTVFIYFFFSCFQRNQKKKSKTKKHSFQAAIKTWLKLRINNNNEKKNSENGLCLISEIRGKYIHCSGKAADDDGIVLLSSWPYRGINNDNIGMVLFVGIKLEISGCWNGSVNKSQICGNLFARLILFVGSILDCKVRKKINKRTNRILSPRGERKRCVFLSPVLSLHSLQLFVLFLFLISLFCL